jgi:NTE family protein
MTRALVLGGGGPVGVGWESGLAVGLAREGVVISESDLIVGTSAGSIVGARLALQMDLAAMIAAVSQPRPVEPGAGDGIGQLLTAWADAAARSLSPEETRVELGQFALTAQTPDEDTYVAADVFAQVKDCEWPKSFRCAAVGTRTGALQVWDQAARVPLARAVASSCAVPGVFPPVTIGAERYMDGGMRSPLNADLAVGHAVVIVVSCLALALPDGFSDPMFDATSRQLEAEFALVRDSGAALEVVGPGQEFLDISGWGASLMNPALTADAYQAGLRQAAAEAERLRAVWNS